ncbi:MAG: hypothetical protein ABH867_00305 [Patescibacteria group bacterium]
MIGKKFLMLESHGVNLWYQSKRSVGAKILNQKTNSSTGLIRQPADYGFLGLCITPLLFLGLVASLFGVRAQSDEYLGRRDNYVRSSQEYFSARQAYLNQKTLQTREILLSKLKSFLTDRNDFLVIYFDFLYTRANQYLVEGDVSELRSWLLWLKSQSQKISEAVSPDDFLFLNDQLNKNYPQMETAVYFVLAKMTIAEQELIIRKMELLQQEIAGKILDLVDNKETAIYWLDEVEAKINLVKRNHEEALTAMKKVKINRKGDILKGWKTAEKKFAEADSNLRTGLGFLDEIIKRVEKDER